MQDLKSAIKLVWFGIAVSLISLFSYMLRDEGDLYLLLFIISIPALFILAYAAILRISRAKARIESDVDFHNLVQVRMFTGIFRWMSISVVFAIVVSLVEVFSGNKGDILYLSTVPLATVIFTSAVAFSFASYMRKHVQLFKESIEQVPSSRLMTQLSREATAQNADRERELWGDGPKG